jgi:2-dehydro-3-deoxyglucarate aldolase
MKHTNKVLEKIKKGNFSLGSWVLSNSVASAEIMAQACFDWVCIDAEHSAVSKETATDMIRAIELHGSEPFVRISLNDEVEIKKYLDMGARGIIVPMIKSYQDVKKAVSYIKFPPEGSRSFALSRATGYGEWSEEYFKYSNNNILIAIMIEHIDAIKDIDQIFSQKGIDAVLVGPYDLSGSMGIPGQFDHPEFKKILKQIHLKAQEHFVTMGFHEVYPTKDKIIKLINQDYKFIACGIDTLFILEKSKEFSSLIDELTK